MTTLTHGIAMEVLSSDVYATRFEDFCNAILGEIEGGAVLLRTSQSWDLGRDGRSVGRGSNIFSCCSLSDDVDAKATADLLHLTEHVKNPAKIYFCSSQRLSEHRCNELSNDLRDLLTNGTEISVLGSIQLAELAVRFPERAMQFYKAEIGDCLRALRDSDATADSELPGLRLALMTAGHEDSLAIRDGVYTAVLLSVFADGNARYLGDCARDLAANLRLHRNLPHDLI